ncbi:MAG: PQQ-dependent sugar dehydrogenase [Opitutaceae bacterium]|nr:PQQ-dependent sugar dehydrogenase [Opitutaceae bacterium]
MLLRLGFALSCVVLSRAALDAAESSFDRGRALYGVTCATCHQPQGEGLKGVIPPLAASDYLVADERRSVRIVLQGLSGPVVVNGVEYNGVMPPPVGLDDAKVADILTFVRASWGNQGGPVLPSTVAAVRAELASPDRPDRDPFEPLPPPPAGFRIREVVKLPQHGVRLATMPGVDWIYVLNNGGDLFRLEPATGNLARVLATKDYADPTRGPLDVIGMTIDSQRRLLLVANQRGSTRPRHTAEMSILRSEPLEADGVPKGVKPWFRVDYPWGVRPGNHGVSHIAEGPDGYIYVSSGSRTDGGEAGNDPVLWKGGEHALTAAIWRIDPRAEGGPRLETFASGVRNAWSFAWNDRGELFSVSNGPDEDEPEELDLIERGKHYGFPWEYGVGVKSKYPKIGTPPAGVKLEPAIRNLGPAGGGSASAPIATFDAHSSPAGMVFCGPEWPVGYQGRFIVGRFGNFIGRYHVGFDLLSVELRRNAAGVYEARTETFLAPVARPLDLLQVGRRLYILEYTRPVRAQAGRPLNPGRVLELSW